MKFEIPFYNILNIFLTGLIFLGGFIFIFPKYIFYVLNNNICSNLCVRLDTIITIGFFAFVYEIGLIINRLGVHIIERPLHKLRFLPFNHDYVLFNYAREKYPIMDSLSREYALARTQIILFLLLLILGCVAKKWWVIILCAVMIILFCFTLKKYAKKIVKLMNSAQSKQLNDKRNTRKE